MSDWESIEELVDFFRVSPAPSYDEAMQALQFTSFSSDLFNHMKVFVINGDIDNPLFFFARVITEDRESEALMVHITDKKMSPRMANIADWFVSDLADNSDMKTYTARGKIVHYLRLSFTDEAEAVTFEELSRRYDARSAERRAARTRRPRVSVQYRRR